MLEHANSPKHLNEMIGDKNNLLAIVGWQAPNTPGRKLQEGAKIIDIPIETFRDGKLTTEIVSKPVIMTVSRYDAFSSHADGCETLEWLSNFKSIGKVFVVHGEKKSTINLSNRISKYLGIPSEAPVLDQSEKLEFDVHQIAVKQSQSKCDGMIRDVLESNITDQ
jgi:metallo-beta-lactamase family protein